MRKKTVVYLIIACFAVSFFNVINVNDEKEAIKKVIQEAWLDGYSNLSNIEAMEKGFHHDYNFLGSRNNMLMKMPFSHFFEGVKIRKIKNPEGSKSKWSGKFVMVETIGKMGLAKVEIFKDAELHGTDYMSLLKFDDGWKLVTSIAQNLEPMNEQSTSEENKEIDAIKKVINEAYIDGLQNLGDIETIQKGFHPGFELLYINNNMLNKLPIYNWIESAKANKEKNPNGPPVLSTIKFLNVDVTGNAGFAEFEIYRDSKIIFTDIMSLLKFKEGWRIVSKISHRH